MDKFSKIQGLFVILVLSYDANHLLGLGLIVNNRRERISRFKPPKGAVWEGN